MVGCFGKHMSRCFPPSCFHVTLSVVVYLVSKALFEVKGPFHLLVNGDLHIARLLAHGAQAIHKGKSISLHFNLDMSLVPQVPLLIPAVGAGGASTGGDNILLMRDTKARQVQEVANHLTLDGNIQCCVGMEAA